MDLLQRQQIGPAEIQRVLFGADAEALKSAAQAVDSSGDGVSTQVPPFPQTGSLSQLVVITTNPWIFTII
jgi:hypothetical protein